MLTISILNYRNWRATVQCVHEVAAACRGLDFRILVRDNSEESELDRIRCSLAGEVAGIQYFTSPENPGFGAGHNRNFREVAHQPDDQFLILNNDISMSDSSCIRAMVAASSENRIVSCVVRSSKTNGVWFAGGQLNRITGDLAILRDEFVGDLRTTDFISGCCMMVPARMFKELGGFDETFFMYGEDLDLCLRAREAGARLVLVNRSLLHEVGSGQRGHYSDLYLYENTKNRIWTLKTHKLGLPVIRDVYFVTKYGIGRSAQLMLFSRVYVRQIKVVWRGIVDGYGSNASPSSSNDAAGGRRCENDVQTNPADHL